MKPFYRILFCIFLFVIIFQISCSSLSNNDNNYNVKNGGKVEAKSFVIRIDKIGKIYDEYNEEVNEGYILSHIENKKLSYSDSVIILVRGTQKIGVLESVQMFSLAGFKSISIKLVYDEPLR